MFVLTLVQSHTHVDIAQNVLDKLVTSAEITQWRYLVHMAHLWEEIHQGSFSLSCRCEAVCLQRMSKKFLYSKRIETSSAVHSYVTVLLWSMW